MTTTTATNELPVVPYVNSENAKSETMLLHGRQDSNPSSITNPIGYRPHPFNVEQFGSQERLVEKLRSSYVDGETLEVFLATLIT